MEKKSLYSSEVYEKCQSRIEQLTSETQPQWGSMTVAQMLAHCSEIQEVTNGKDLKNRPFIVKLFCSMIRTWLLVRNPIRRALKLIRSIYKPKIVIFANEKKRLLDALAQFVDDKEKSESAGHPLFGKMTVEEKGWSMVKHLDHHLTQFGV